MNEWMNDWQTEISIHLISASPTTGQLEPITVYDRWGVHVCLHFCRDSPPARPDVAVVIVSSVNTSALSVSDVEFQVAVPKVHFFSCSHSAVVVSQPCLILVSSVSSRLMYLIYVTLNLIRHCSDVSLHWTEPLSVSDLKWHSDD